MSRVVFLRPWPLLLALMILPLQLTASGAIPTDDWGPDGCMGCEADLDGETLDDTAPDTDPGADTTPPQEPQQTPTPPQEAARSDPFESGEDPCELRSGPDSCAKPRTCRIVTTRQRVRMGGKVRYRIVRGKTWICGPLAR